MNNWYKLRHRNLVNLRICRNILNELLNSITRNTSPQRETFHSVFLIFSRGITTCVCILVNERENKEREREKNTITYTKNLQGRMRERRIKRGCCRDKNGKPRRREWVKRSGNSFNRLIISFKAVVSRGAFRYCLQRQASTEPRFVWTGLWTGLRKKEEGARRSRGRSSFASEQPDSSFCKIKRSLGC